MRDNSANFTFGDIWVPNNNPSFEEQLDALQTIVEQLEKGDLSLDSSLSQFEKGVTLTKGCQKLLDQAQQKVSILTQNNQLEAFDKG